MSGSGVFPLAAADWAPSVPPPLTACVSIGDRYDIDLLLPLELGMGGILVDGVEDVYKVPGILEPQTTRTTQTRTSLSFLLSVRVSVVPPVGGLWLIFILELALKKP
ncbi:hypothetical protein FACS189445_2140 [Spirochaetia bacterium]|nr:hypothetical protein FACS189445_2140 [Spirochaetia bacterium]